VNSARARCSEAAPFFLNVFEPPPLSRNAQKRDKKKSNKTTEGGKKTEGKKAAFVVMSSDGFFSKKVFSVFLNSPCYETLQCCLQVRAC
jgi:hypothetical protein